MQFILAWLLSILLWVPLVGATEGQTLHDAHCLACHDPALYTGKAPKVKSLDALKAQVERCSHGALGLDWGSTEIDTVTRYLNENFYRFKE